MERFRAASEEIKEKMEQGYDSSDIIEGQLVSKKALKLLNVAFTNFPKAEKVPGCLSELCHALTEQLEQREEEPRRSALFAPFSSRLATRIDSLRPLGQIIHPDYPVPPADTIKVAADAHMGVVNIHPFPDSNGRTARMLMNLALLQGGRPAVAFKLFKPYNTAVASDQKGHKGVFERFLRRIVAQEEANIPVPFYELQKKHTLALLSEKV